MGEGLGGGEPDYIAEHPEVSHGPQSRRCPCAWRASPPPRPGPIKGAGVPCRGACATLRRPGMCACPSACAGAEIEIKDCAQRFRRRACLKVLRQRIRPCSVTLLEFAQRLVGDISRRSTAVPTGPRSCRFSAEPLCPTLKLPKSHGMIDWRCRKRNAVESVNPLQILRLGSFDETEDCDSTKIGTAILKTLITMIPSKQVSRLRHVPPVGDPSVRYGKVEVHPPARGYQPRGEAGSRIACLHNWKRPLAPALSPRAGRRRRRAGHRLSLPVARVRVRR
jgi:hypothetical protein